MAASAPAWPPRLDLGTFPTPVRRLAAVSRAARAEVWVKDDAPSSARYGGGKVRKLEFVLADPRIARAGCILSAGALGSHHLLALALHLSVLGRAPCAVVCPQEASPHVWRNLAAIASHSARVIYAPARAAVPAVAVPHALAHGLGRGLAVIGPGATSALGMAGFVGAGFELAEDVRAGRLPAPGTVVIAGGTGGAAAGLWTGLRWAGMPCRLRVARVVEPWVLPRARLRWLARRAAARLGTAPPAGVGDLVLDGSQAGPTYGAATPAALEAVALARQDGLALETTYTGKALAALLAAAAAAIDPPPVVFWNTHAGPVPASAIAPDWRTRLPADLQRRAPEVLPDGD